MNNRKSFLSKSETESIKLWTKQIEESPEESLKSRDWSILKLNYKIAGTGKNRIVYDLDNGLVLKVSISLRGIKHNFVEYDLYNTVSSCLKDHLAAIVDHGYGWNIMEKLDVEVPRSKKNKKKVLRIYQNFIEEGIRPRDILSKNKKNARWKNLGMDQAGKIKVLDYGDFLRWE
ncbi:hypothetical protein [Ammoniphilus sp. YIM 78166]|uniref:hypothetical protein n=1 Tax=Ammoniphilus sp. YIM 78166 TaxID=1644106 RepID=UPI00106F1CD1|nr:hypothetical protein [Ammoniphilus sp. YIM 78166]